MAPLQCDIQDRNGCANAREGGQKGGSQGSGLSALKERVARLERGTRVDGVAGERARSPSLATGFAAVDRALPTGGLASDGVHEVTGMAAEGFLLRLLSSTFRQTSILWCVSAREEALLYGPGLDQAGVVVDRLLIARFRGREEGLWVMEEGLRSAGLDAVVAEVDGRIDLTASRRLQLAAEKGGTPGFLLNRVDSSAAGFPRTDPSALSTRWRVDPIDPAGNPETGRIQRRWAVTLSRCRGGARGRWEVSPGEGACA